MIRLVELCLMRLFGTGGSIAKENTRNLNGFIGRVDDIAGPLAAADVDTVAGAVGSGLVLAALRTTMAVQIFRVLYSKHEKLEG
jgi:hypothetical protein